MKKRLFALSGLVLLSQIFLGCSSEPDNSCARAADCDRGTVCLEGGECGEYACSGAGECSATPPFVEGCLLADSSGAYDPSQAGVCSAQECRSNDDCRGAEAQCIDNICYSSVAADIPCATRDSCPPGQACMAGICATNTEGFCSDTNECPVGQSCDASHVCVDDAGACNPACGTGETCVDGACQPATVTCDPACGDGETCVDGACIPEGEVGGLCETCTTDAECGGASDRCVIMAGADPFCGQDCSGASGCPSGYTCQTVDTAGSQQCVPTGNAPCAGCLVDGCTDGQFCNASSGNCESYAGVCEACVAADQCGDSAQCLSIGGSPHCLTNCADGCGDGYTCTTISGREVCAPESGACGGSTTCELTAADCSGATAVFDDANCRCVGCLSASDCGTDQLCSDSGTCLSGSGSCTSTAECGDGYCQSGVCIECLGNSDCDGQPCIAGACTACECPAGQRCSPIDGSCEDIPATGDCTTDTECIQAAQAMGHTGEGVLCDPNIGCFVMGACGGTDMLGMPLTDGAFDAGCPIGLVCQSNISAEGQGICTGCDPTNPNSCRLGETCMDFFITQACTGGFGL